MNVSFLSRPVFFNVWFSEMNEYRVSGRYQVAPILSDTAFIV